MMDKPQEKVRQPRYKTTTDRQLAKVEDFEELEGFIERLKQGFLNGDIYSVMIDIAWFHHGRN